MIHAYSPYRSFHDCMRRGKSSPDGPPEGDEVLGTFTRPTDIKMPTASQAIPKFKTEYPAAYHQCLSSLALTKTGGPTNTTLITVENANGFLMPAPVRLLPWIVLIALALFFILRQTRNSGRAPWLQCSERRQGSRKVSAQGHTNVTVEDDLVRHRGSQGKWMEIGRVPQ